MASHGAAHSVPGLDISGLITADKPFWAGPNLPCAPHLPVGSPEREALFKALRAPFVEDWIEAEEAVIEARYASMGDLYFMVADSAVKIGRSTNVKARLRHTQTHNHEALTVAVWLKGQGWREREFHSRFKRWRIHHEWFERTPEIEAEIELLNLAPQASQPNPLP